MGSSGSLAVKSKAGKSVATWMHLEIDQSLGNSFVNVEAAKKSARSGDGERAVGP